LTDGSEIALALRVRPLEIRNTPDIEQLADRRGDLSFPG
jgi:hypothetical protein